jgi:protein-tyrosine phosphatase
VIWGDTDWHCHILPGVDDGPRSLDESLGMARAAAQLGFTKIVATPHFEAGVYENCRETVLMGVKSLNDALRDVGIPVEVHPGSEIMLSPDIAVLLREGRLMTVMDRGIHVLVELPLSQCPLWAEHVLAEIKEQGLVPVLAHPERYGWMNEDKLAALYKQGIHFQFNAGSLVGKYGNRAAAFTKTFKEKGYVVQWGSDAHSEIGYEVLKMAYRYEPL